MNGLLINTLVRRFNFNSMVSMPQHVCGASCGSLWHWDVPQILSQRKRNYTNYGMMILNRPLTQSHNFLKNFWNGASVRITVDGGTKQWDSLVSKMPEEMQKSLKLPDLITGDFDSITDEVLQKYQKKGCEVVHTPDQDFTDFTKALIELYKYCQKHKTEIENVIAFGQSSGRIDQILGNIQTLHLSKEKHLLSPNIKLYIMSDDALSWLLNPGDHVISIPEETLKHKKAWCSLVPIGEGCQWVTTTGLKWNLDRQPLKFGELVSTSNAFSGSPTVKVSCSNTVLWSMRIPSVISGS